MYFIVPLFVAVHFLLHSFSPLYLSIVRDHHMTIADKILFGMVDNSQHFSQCSYDVSVIVGWERSAIQDCSAKSSPVVRNQALMETDGEHKPQQMV